MVITLSTKDLTFNSIITYPDVSIEKGSVTFISGPSGCGKSTLLRLFNVTYTPSHGSIFFDGINMEELEAVSLRRKIVLAGQLVYLFKGSIDDNFRIFHEYHESILPSESELNEYLKICCLEIPLRASCDVMSGGEKQRIFLAIALSLNPQILLLDEPTSALDRNLADHVIKNIIDWCKHKYVTLVMVSHDRGLQDKYAETIIELEENRK